MIPYEATSHFSDSAGKPADYDILVAKKRFYQSPPIISDAWPTAERKHFRYRQRRRDDQDLSSLRSI
jgi:hypothetical protein